VIPPLDNLYINKKCMSLLPTAHGLKTFTLKTQEKNKKLQIIWHAFQSMELWEESERTDNLEEVISRYIRRVLSEIRGKVSGPDGASIFLGIIIQNRKSIKINGYPIRTVNIKQ
jgi:hypothetical protein